MILDDVLDAFGIVEESAEKDFEYLGSYDSDRLTSAIVTIRAWLSAQPVAPEPEWTQFEHYQDDEGYYGPDCFVMSPWGDTAHYFCTADLEPGDWFDGFPDPTAIYASERKTVDLDPAKTLGIDWRTTLRHRPTETPLT